MAYTQDTPDVKYYGFYWGVVTRNDDPERRGRIRAEVPGMYKDMKWAVPLGFPGSGGPPGGGYCVPPLESQVVIGFIQGDREEPFYFTGPPAINEAPSAVRDTSLADADVAKVHTFETSNFAVTITDKADVQQIRIGDKTDENAIEIDLQDGSLYFKAKRYIIFEAPLFSVEQKGKIQIGGRIVMPVGPPI